MKYRQEKLITASNLILQIISILRGLISKNKVIQTYELLTISGRNNEMFFFNLNNL